MDKKYEALFTPFPDRNVRDQKQSDHSGYGGHEHCGQYGRSEI